MKSNPTYKQMKDHTETVQLDYDPEVISYRDILSHFWLNHNPNRKKYRDREYISLILYHDEKQRDVAFQMKNEIEQAAGKEIQTEIAPCTEFALAEWRQQKWHVKRVKSGISRLTDLYPAEEDLTNSTLAARLNSLAKGFGSLEAINSEIELWQIDEQYRKQLLDLVNSIEWEKTRYL